MDLFSQLHIDLETLDTAHTAQMLSIGACIADKEFYVEVDTSFYDMFYDTPGDTTPSNPKFTKSSDTVAWWAEQGGFIPTTAPISPMAATAQLVRWITDNSVADMTVWANSPSFDCEILKYHMTAYGLQCPWPFYVERDVRTIKDLAKKIHLPINFPKNPHNALQDARNQQKLVESVFRTLAQKVELASEAERSAPLDIGDT